MDPDEALRQIRQIVRAVATEDLSGDEVIDCVNDLFDYVDGLDVWLSREDFFPPHGRQHARNRALIGHPPSV